MIFAAVNPADGGIRVLPEEPILCSFLPAMIKIWAVNPAKGGIRVLPGEPNFCTEHALLCLHLAERNHRTLLLWTNE